MSTHQMEKHFLETDDVKICVCDVIISPSSHSLHSVLTARFLLKERHQYYNDDTFKNYSYK